MRINKINSCSEICKTITSEREEIKRTSNLRKIKITTLLLIVLRSFLCKHRPGKEEKVEGGEKRSVPKSRICNYFVEKKKSSCWHGVCKSGTRVFRLKNYDDDDDEPGSCVLLLYHHGRQSLFTIFPCRWRKASSRIELKVRRTKKSALFHLPLSAGRALSPESHNEKVAIRWRVRCSVLTARAIGEHLL